MEIKTHRAVNTSLCGIPKEVSPGVSRIELQTTADMAVDETGLVHGGFIFGVADYAAMIAVNDPKVVLAGAEVKFLKPVRAGQTVTAEAKVTESCNKKRKVSATVFQGEEKVFTGRFNCYVPDRHVLADI